MAETSVLLVLTHTDATGSPASPDLRLDKTGNAARPEAMQVAHTPMVFA